MKRPIITACLGIASLVFMNFAAADDSCLQSLRQHLHETGGGSGIWLISSNYTQSSYGMFEFSTDSGPLDVTIASGCQYVNTPPFPAGVSCPYGTNIINSYSCTQTASAFQLSIQGDGLSANMTFQKNQSARAGATGSITYGPTGQYEYCDHNTNKYCDIG